MVWEPTPEQAAFVAHDAHEHARLIAGPGTGKSAAVIRFMIRAAEEQGLAGKLLTFTRAATNELREKVIEHGDALGRPSTVHSFAVSILLGNPGASTLPEPIRIADDWEWETLIREHLSDLVGCGVRMIDRARMEMSSAWESLVPGLDPKVPVAVRNQFSGAWEQHRRVFGYSLLAELPYRLLRALEDHPGLVLGDWHYLAVDEYQDLNLCDLTVLKSIAARGKAVIGSGDDDQSIYSFRKAHPIGIQRFVAEDYPSAADFTLSVGQRCATSILTWAQHVIQGLPGRPARPELVPAPHCLSGEAKYLRFVNWTEEAQGVGRLVRWLIDQRHVPPEDIAIMFRTNYRKAWSGPLSTQFAALAVPTVDTAEVDEMLEEPSNRRLLALAKLLVSREDSLAWWTLLDLTGGIGPVVRDHFYNRAVDRGTTFAIQLLRDHLDGYPELGTTLRNRVRTVVVSNLSLIDAVNLEGALLGAAGWGAWLAAAAADLGGCEARFAELLVELDDHVEHSEDLRRFLGQIQPVANDLRSGRAAKSVRLMTMAGSKGLTVRVAIVVGVEDGVMPLANADAGEERRLLYVAMTRSSEYLYLTWSGSRTGPTARTGAPLVAQGRNRSPFLTHGPVPSESGAKYLTQVGA